MADEKDLKQAQEVYATLCQALDGDDWNYKRIDEKLAITAGARGEDLPIEFSVEVDAERKLIILLSHMLIPAVLTISSSISTKSRR